MCMIIGVACCNVQEQQIEFESMTINIEHVYMLNSIIIVSILCDAFEGTLFLSKWVHGDKWECDLSDENDVKNFEQLKQNADSLNDVFEQLNKSASTYLEKRINSTSVDVKSAD